MGGDNDGNDLLKKEISPNLPQLVCRNIKVQSEHSRLSLDKNSVAHN